MHLPRDPKNDQGRSEIPKGFFETSDQRVPQILTVVTWDDGRSGRSHKGTGSVGEPSFY